MIDHVKETDAMAELPELTTQFDTLCGGALEPGLQIDNRRLVSHREKVRKNHENNCALEKTPDGTCERIDRNYTRNSRNQGRQKWLLRPAPQRYHRP